MRKTSLREGRSAPQPHHWHLSFNKTFTCLGLFVSVCLFAVFMPLCQQRHKKKGRGHRRYVFRLNVHVNAISQEHLEWIFSNLLQLFYSTQFWIEEILVLRGQRSLWLHVCCIHMIPQELFCAEGLNYSHFRISFFAATSKFVFMPFCFCWYWRWLSISLYVTNWYTEA